MNKKENMGENKSTLEKLIDMLNETKKVEYISEDFIQAIDFTIKLVKHTIPVIEAEIELAKQNGYNEALKETIERFKVEE
jgi:flagellar biosynthesis regulator FlaF